MHTKIEPKPNPPLSYYYSWPGGRKACINMVTKNWTAVKVSLFMKNGIIFIHGNIWENLMSDGLTQGILTLFQQKRFLLINKEHIMNTELLAVIMNNKVQTQWKLGNHNIWNLINSCLRNSFHPIPSTHILKTENEVSRSW